MDLSDQVFLIPELRRNILLQSDYDSVISSCRSRVEFQNVCRDPAFWEEKALKDFGISPEEFNNTDLNPSKRYLQLLTERGEIAIGS